MKKEVLTGESELEANTLSSTPESLSHPAACRCEEACAVWWKGTPINSAPDVSHLSPCCLRRKSFGSPGQVDSLHIFLAPYYTIFANRKRSSCSPSPATPGKGVSVHITMRRAFLCRACMSEICPSDFCVMMLSFVTSWEWKVWL